MMSQRDVAKTLGITQQRVGQIERSAFRKIRIHLSRLCPEAELRDFANHCGTEKDPYQTNILNWKR